MSAEGLQARSDGRGRLVGARSAGARRRVDRPACGRALSETRATADCNLRFGFSPHQSSLPPMEPILP
eukprot:scaffold209873_cov22-Tisochrysis_lutea.AAC.1